VHTFDYSEKGINNSDILNKLLIHIFQETIKGIDVFEALDLERRFSGGVHSEHMQYSLNILETQGLIEKIKKTTGHHYKLTREGVKIGYNLYEYDLQIVTNDIYSSYEPLKKLNITEASSVLDIGCGAGQTLVAICRNVNPHLAVGIDVEENNLSFAYRQSSMYLKTSSHCSFLTADADDLPFICNSFTHIIFRQALYLVSARKAMAELARVLCPGGIAYIRVPSWKHVLGYFKRKNAKSTLRGLFVLLNGTTFHLFGKQLRIYVKSHETFYGELFYTKRAIIALCKRHMMVAEIVPTPASKGGIMVLARKTL